MTRVAVLKGGRSLERQISLKSGVGMPASRMWCLASTLSAQRMQADTPDPV